MNNFTQSILASNTVLEQLNANGSLWVLWLLLAIISILIVAISVLTIMLVRKRMPKYQAAPATAAEKDIDAVSKKQRTMKVLVQIGLYAFLIIMAIIVLFPFYWMLMSSVKTIDEYNRPIPTMWPQEFKWSNYATAFSKIDFGTVLGNTILVGVVSTALSLVVTVLSAYALARFNFKGKNILFAGMLATMMIPGELFTITNYVTVIGIFQMDTTKIGTFAALILPFLVSVFYIYLLRQNFMQIPNELYLAAKVDGTSDLKYLWKVMIPLAAPTLISITILKMMGAWNTYIWPNLILPLNPETGKISFQLMTVALRNAEWGEAALVDYPAQMAAVVLVTLPLLIVFMLFRKYIIRGVSRSGTKG